MGSGQFGDTGIAIGAVWEEWGEEVETISSFEYPQPSYHDPNNWVGLAAQCWYRPIHIRLQNAAPMLQRIWEIYGQSLRQLEPGCSTSDLCARNDVISIHIYIYILIVLVLKLFIFGASNNLYYVLLCVPSSPDHQTLQMLYLRKFNTC